MDTFGLNFAPLDQNKPNMAQPGTGSPAGGGSNTPIQDAIQTLSLRIPHVVGAGALAPDALLNSPGGSAIPGGTGLTLEALLRRLFAQPGGLQGVPTGGPVASMPMSPMPGLGGAPLGTTPSAPPLPRIGVGTDVPGLGAPPPAPAPPAPAAPLLPRGPFGRGQ